MFFSACPHLHVVLHSPWFYVTAGVKMCDYLQYKLTQGCHFFFLVKETGLAHGAYELMFAQIFFPIFTTVSLNQQPG